MATLKPNWLAAPFVVGLFALVGGCAYMFFELQCPPGQDCGYRIGVRFVICEDGTVVPVGEECPDHLPPAPPPPPEESAVYDVLYTTNYGISMFSQSTIGALEIYEDNSLKSVIAVPFSTIGNRQVLTDPAQLHSQLIAEMTSSTSTYSGNLRPPGITLTTTAPEGATVSLDASFRVNGLPVGSTSTSYEAGPDGGLPSESDVFGGPD